MGELARPVTQLVGRDRELRELAGLLGARRIVTVAGPGGVGKTRLAIAAAAERQPTFAVDLSGTRAVEVEAVGATMGLGSNPSLTALAEAAPPPWSELLQQHRRAFLTLTAEVSALAEANRDLLTTGARAVRETMLSVAGSVETYSRRGETVAAAPRTRLIDEAM